MYVRQLAHDCDSTRGSSGSSLYFYEDDEPVIIGLHHAAFMKGSTDHIPLDRYSNYYANLAIKTADIVFVLKVKKQSFLSRLKKRKSRNRYDNFPVKFYIKAQNAFLKISKNKKNHIILESSKNTPELQKKIFEIIKKRIGLK